MKKILKDNVWNRLFHKKEIIEQTEFFDKCNRISVLSNEILLNVSKANNLTELMQTHIFAWKYGFRNHNLGPCSYGMFRTEDIENMSSKEVYLGNIWGLSTKNIDFWDEHKEEDMNPNGFGINPETKCYDLIMNQYRTLLRRNIESISKEARDYVESYKKVNKPEDPFKMW